MNYRKPTTTEIKKIENYLKDYLKRLNKYSDSVVIPFAEFFDYENETNAPAPKYHLTQVEDDKCKFINCIQTDEYFNLKMKQYKKHNQQQTVSYASDYPKNFLRFKLKIIRNVESRMTFANTIFRYMNHSYVNTINHKRDIAV